MVYFKILKFVERKQYIISKCNLNHKKKILFNSIYFRRIIFHRCLFIYEMVGVLPLDNSDGI